MKIKFLGTLITLLISFIDFLKGYKDSEETKKLSERTSKIVFTLISQFLDKINVDEDTSDNEETSKKESEENVEKTNKLDDKRKAELEKEVKKRLSEIEKKDKSKKEETDIKKETKSEEEDKNDSTILMYPVLSPCKVITRKGIERELKLDSFDLKFPVYATKEEKEANNNKYPTKDELEQILVDAWDMICLDQSNKSVNIFLKENIKEYYTDIIKKDKDWYHITNAFRKAIKLLKGAFGEDANSNNILLTKPSVHWDDDEMDVLTSETDIVIQEVEKETETAKTEEKTVETENSEELETVQDEEQQEEKVEVKTEETETAKAEETETAKAEETETEELSVPPEVHSFEEFNDLERGFFEIMKKARINQRKEKDSKVQQKIRTDALLDARMLISSWFEEDEKAKWAVAKDDGSWSNEMKIYSSKILSACANHYDD